MQLRRTGGIAASLFLFLSSGALASEELITCKVPIADKICYTLNHKSRECIEAPEELVPYKLEEQLELIHAVAPPPVMQQMMCDLDTLYVAKEIHSHASASQIDSVMHLSWPAVHRYSRTLESHLESEFSRYGRSAQYLELEIEYHPSSLRFSDAHQMTYEVVFEDGRIEDLNYSLANLIYHELAHLMEAHPRVNNNYPSGFFVCNYRFQKEHADALNTSDADLRGYAVALKTFPELGQTSALLAELERSNYSTFYAMAHHKEDFAEMMSEYIMFNHLGVNYRILKDGQVLFERAKQFENENIKTKLAIVEIVLNWPSYTKKQKRDLRTDRRVCRGLFDPSLMTSLEH